MERNQMTLFALILIIPLAWFFPDIAGAQSSFEDDGMVWTSFATSDSPIPQSRQDDSLLWIAFELVDGDARVGDAALLDSWSEKCSTSSPTSLRDWMPLGIRQDHPRQQRSLPEGACERVVALRLSGFVSGELAFDKAVPWQPGKNGERWLGFQRDGTTNVRIKFPRTILINDRLYDAPDPVIVRTGGSERLVVARVTLRRLAVANLSEDCNQFLRLDKYFIRVSSTRAILLPGTRLLRAQKGQKLAVIVTDNQGERHQLTSSSYPETILEIPAHYGWEYEVEIVPKLNGRREWIASLPRDGM